MESIKGTQSASYFQDSLTDADVAAVVTARLRLTDRSELSLRIGRVSSLSLTSSASCPTTVLRSAGYL